MNRKIIILLLVFILGLVLRLYKLNEYPALNADEAALGYNAYSLLQTGRDEHGNSWPLHFQSFNDYKPGLTVYLIMPVVHFFGLNILSVRILPALLSSLTVISFYFFVKRLRSTYFFKEGSFSLELVAAFLLAINPWHLHFSRGAWEVSVAAFFVVTGMYYGIRKKPTLVTLILSVLFLSLSLYTYHAARLITPLLGLALIAIQSKDILQSRLKYLKVSLIGLFILLPLITAFSGPAGLSRASGVGIFSDTGPLNRVNEQRGHHSEISSISSKLLHNKITNYSLALVSNWGEHYHGEFLFISGDDIQRNKVPETGLLYLFEIVTIAVGLWYISKNTNGWGSILWWLLIAPIPAALTFQSPHSLRAHYMIFPLILISAYGIIKLARNKLVLIGLILITALSFTRYLLMYYAHMSKEYPFSSQYGVQELVDYVKENYHKYDQIVITDRYDQPYILFLFYMQYPPQEFQENHILTDRDQFGFSTVRDFDKFVFRSITNWDQLRQEYPNSLIVGTDEEIYHGTNVVKRIYFPNGDIAFELVDN